MDSFRALVRTQSLTTSSKWINQTTTCFENDWPVISTVKFLKSICLPIFFFSDSDKDFKSDEICFRYSIWHPKRIKLQCAGKEIRYMCHFGLGDLPKVFFNQSCTFANKFDLHVPNGRDAIACVHAHLTSWVASVRLWSFFDGGS